MGSQSLPSIVITTMMTTKFFLSLFLVFLSTPGSISDDHEIPPGCPSNYTCPSYVNYKGYDYRIAFCSKWIPCWNSPFPTCVYSSGWQYWCFEKGTEGIYPVQVYEHLDEVFTEIQQVGGRIRETNFTSTYNGVTTPFDDNNNAGDVTGMTLWSIPRGGNTLVCSALNTTYNSMPRGDTFHGTVGTFVSQFNSNNNSPRIYRITGFRAHGSDAQYLSGMKMDWTSGRDSGSIFCGPTDPGHTLTRINLTPRYAGSCTLQNIKGTVDQVDGKLIRELGFKWSCAY